MLIETFSGIRGIYGENLTEDTAKRYAYGFYKLLSKKRDNISIVIGTDTRPSCNLLKKAFSDGFLKLGCNVIDVNINTTPAIQLAVREYKADGGVVISASHNEPEWNGWKLLSNNGSVLSEKELEIVINVKNNISIKLIEEEISRNKKKGRYSNREEELIDKYTSYVLDALGKEGIEQIRNAKLKIVIDPNGGAAAVVIKEILERLNTKIIPLNMEIGKFNRIIEPNRQTLAFMSAIVKKNKADIGAGWDCDGDRVELVDENGELLSGHYILALLVEEILSQHKGKNLSVVINDATSYLVKEVAENHNAKVYEVEVGEINVVEKMDEVNAAVGGEGSSAGGIFPPSKCRDGILTLVMTMKLIARTKKKLSRVYEEFPKYYTPKLALKCDENIGKIVKQEIEKYFKLKGYKIQKTGDETGGLKIFFDKSNSWLWFRGSKTELGVFRIFADSKDKGLSDRMLKEGENVFNEICGKLKK